MKACYELAKYLNKPFVDDTNKIIKSILFEFNTTIQLNNTEKNPGERCWLIEPIVNGG